MTPTTQSTRRSFLSHAALALPTVALADLLARDGLLLADGPAAALPT